MTDYKQLCAELVSAVDRLLGQGESPANPGQRLILTVHVEDLDALADRARAALAEPEPERPTPSDEELMALAVAVFEDQFATDKDYARAVLARWGTSNLAEIRSLLGDAPPPAAGEVAELARLMREEVSELRAGGHLTSDERLRAADLLERLSPPQPVPVSERLPGDELCWWYELDEDDGYGGTWTLLRIRGGTTRYSHWLPAHALPLPRMNND